jgi:hypothetical protein
MQEPAPPEPGRHLFHRVSLIIIASLIAVPLMLQATGATATAQTAGSSDAVPTLASSASVTAASAPQPLNRRVIALRRKETSGGARLTLTSDSPLDDYSSYVEGERLFILMPLTALAGAQSNWSGRGYSDMRVEPSGQGLLLSFRLQVGASVYVRQHFNRLDVAFSTLEQASRN